MTRQPHRMLQIQLQEERVPRRRWPFEASVAGLYQQTVLLRSRLGLSTIIECEYPFHPTRKWRFDIALLALRIGIEYHGGLFMGRRGGHQTVKGARTDWEKMNEAQILGWIVLQFGPDETRSGEAMNIIERVIKARITTPDLKGTTCENS